MKYNLMDDCGYTFIGWLLLECMGDKFEEMFHLSPEEYQEKMGNLDVELKIAGHEVDFVSTIKQIENNMDQIVLKKANELINSKQYQLEMALKEYQEKINDIISVVGDYDD